MEPVTGYLAVILRPKQNISLVLIDVNKMYGVTVQPVPQSELRHTPGWRDPQSVWYEFRGELKALLELFYMLNSLIDENQQPYIVDSRVFIDEGMSLALLSQCIGPIVDPDGRGKTTQI